jgi:hypothetical protein
MTTERDRLLHAEGLLRAALRELNFCLRYPDPTPIRQLSEKITRFLEDTCPPPQAPSAS